MDDSADKSAGEHERQQPEAAKTPPADAASGGAASSSEGHLPIVWSPRLHAGEEFDADYSDDGAEAPIPPFTDNRSTEHDAEASAAPAEEVPLSRHVRFALLAASIAVAAAFGSFVGALSASGVAHLVSSSAPTANAAAPVSAPAAKAELAELSALKANVDGVSRTANAQFAKIADRLDHVERAQIEPAVKLAHIADAVDRLEKKAIGAAAPAPETTGTVPSNPPAPAVEAKPPATEKVLPDWIVQDVRGGRALVESKFGAVFDVSAGSVIPGLGKVETIKRQDGQWIVVTARGLISSSP
jgi:hypothetical protein